MFFAPLLRHIFLKYTSRKHDPDFGAWQNNHIEIETGRDAIDTLPLNTLNLEFMRNQFNMSFRPFVFQTVPHLNNTAALLNGANAITPGWGTDKTMPSILQSVLLTWRAVFLSISTSQQLAVQLLLALRSGILGTWLKAGPDLSGVQLLTVVPEVLSLRVFLVEIPTRMKKPLHTQLCVCVYIYICIT